MMIKMQLNITLKYSIINILTIKKRIYLSAKERHNIIQEDDETTRTPRRLIKPESSFRSFVLEIIFLLNFKS